MFVTFFFLLYEDYFLDMFFFFSSRRRHTRLQGDWSSDVCSSDLEGLPAAPRDVRELGADMEGFAELVGVGPPRKDLLDAEQFGADGVDLSVAPPGRMVTLREYRLPPVDRHGGQLDGGADDVHVMSPGAQVGFDDQRTFLQ